VRPRGSRVAVEHLLPGLAPGTGPAHARVEAVARLAREVMPRHEPVVGHAAPVHGAVMRVHVEEAEVFHALAAREVEHLVAGALVQGRAAGTAHRERGAVVCREEQILSQAARAVRSPRI
jgi:hypothetical protein